MDDQWLLVVIITIHDGYWWFMMVKQLPMVDGWSRITISFVKNPCWLWPIFDIELVVTRPSLIIINQQFSHHIFFQHHDGSWFIMHSVRLGLALSSQVRSRRSDERNGWRSGGFPVANQRRLPLLCSFRTRRAITNEDEVGTGAPRSWTQLKNRYWFIVLTLYIYIHTYIYYIYMYIYLLLYLFVCFFILIHSEYYWMSRWSLGASHALQMLRNHNENRVAHLGSPTSHHSAPCSLWQRRLVSWARQKRGSIIHNKK